MSASAYALTTTDGEAPERGWADLNGLVYSTTFFSGSFKFFIELRF